MKKYLKQILLVVSCTGMLLSCAHMDGSKDWLMNDETLGNMIQLNARQEVVGNTLVAELDYDNVTFNDSLSKENMLVHPSNNKSSYENITYDLLKKNSIDNYSFSLDANKKVLSLCIPGYDGTMEYDFVINAKGSSHTSFLEAHLGDFTTDLNQESSAYLSKKNYSIGETNPTFVIEYSNDKVIGDESKISFGGQFKNLNIGDVQVFDSLIIIHTTGNIADEGDGYIYLSEGFFKNNAYSFRAYADDIGAYVDDDSIQYKDGTLSFVIEACGDYFEKDLVPEYFTFADSETTFTKVERLDNGGKVKLSLTCDSTDIDAEVSEIRNKCININDKALAYSSETVEAKIHALEPILYSAAIVDKEKNEINIELLINNGSFEESISKNDITFTGDLENVVPSKIETTSEVCTITVPFESDKSAPISNVSINEDKVRTSWCTKFAKATTGVVGTTATSSSSDDVSQDHFEELIDDYGGSAKTWVGTVLDTMLYTGVIIGGIVDLSSKNYGSGISSVCTGLAELLNVYGINSEDNTQPSMQDLMDKLNTIDRKLDTVSKQITNLGYDLKQEMISVNAGINRLEFENYQNQWESFISDTYGNLDIDKTKFVAKKCEYIVNFLANSTNTVEMKYINETDETTKVTEKKLAKKNAMYPNYSATGEEIVDTVTEVIMNMKDAFKDTRALSARYGGGYTTAIDATLRDDCIKYAISIGKDNTTLIGNSRFTEATKYGTHLYTAIMDDALIYANKNCAGGSYITHFYNLCDQITGKNVKSKLDNYFNMLTCLYNFRSEIDIDLRTLKLDLKKKLQEFYNIGLIMLGGTGYNAEEYASKFTQALAFIDSFNPSTPTSDKGVYCYALNSIVSTSLLFGELKLSYKNQDKNSASLVRDFYWKDVQSNVVNLKGNANLLSLNDILKIKNRRDNIARLCKDKENGSWKEKSMYNSARYGSLYLYLSEYGVIVRDDKNANVTKVIYEYAGENSQLSTNDFTVTCVAKGVSNSKNYFSVNSSYGYRDTGDKREAKYWHACEYRGSMYELTTGEYGEKVINRAAWYDEDHWYWIDKEKWALVQNTAKEKCLAFFKA